MSLPIKYAERVKETTATAGTGTLTLAGAVSGFQAFSQIGDGKSCFYVIDDGASNWEVGIGTYTLSGTLLSRDTVIASSNSNALVSFGVGTKTVRSDLAAYGVTNIDLLNVTKVFNVKAYGAKGDVKTISDAAITTGTAILTSASNPFTADDVNKPISIAGAGAAGNDAGTADYLITTIFSFQNSGQVTLNANASHTVTGKTAYWGTDDATAINAAGTDAAVSGGTVRIPTGTYFVGSSIILYTHTSWVGDGTDTTSLMLKPGATCDIFQSNGFTSLTGGNTTGGIYAFQIRDLSVNGYYYHGGYVHTQINAAALRSDTTLTVLDNTAFPASGTLMVFDNLNNQPGEIISYTGKGGSTTFTGCTRGVENTYPQTFQGGESVELRVNASGVYQPGYGIRIYGYGYLIDDVYIHDCEMDGLYSEWSTSASNIAPDDMMANMHNVRAHACNGHGLWWQGPHDSNMSEGYTYSNSMHGLRLGPTAAGGTKVVKWHSFGQQNYAYSMETLGMLIASIGEQAIGGQCYINQSQAQVIGCRFFATPANIFTRGVVLGPNPVTGSNPSFCVVDTSITDCNGGSVDFTFDGGNNYFRLQIRQQAGGNVFIGTPQVTTNVYATESPQNANALVGTPQQQSAPMFVRSQQGNVQGLILRTPFSQSVNAFEQQQNNGTVINAINQNGCLGINQSTPTFGLHQVGGSQRVVALANPSAPTGTAFGGSGTNAVYFVVAEDIAGNKTLASASVTVSGGATLSASVWNRITPGAITGAIKYYILKTDTAHVLGTISPNIGGVVTLVTVTAGGSGYTGSAPTVGFSGPTQCGPQATATVAANAVTAITINTGAAGSGFTSIPNVVIGGPGNGATATATLGVSNLTTIGAGGSGYVVGDEITLTGGTFSTAAVLKVTQISAGAITAISVKTPGSYSVLPSNPVAQGSTTGAGTGGTFNLLWGISTISVGAGGSGYTSAPSIGFNGGGALPTSTAILTANAISGISVTGGTLFLTSAPTVVLQGVSAGSGATATASIASRSFDDVGQSTSAFTNPTRNATADTTVDGEVIVDNGQVSGGNVAQRCMFTATATAASNTKNTTVSIVPTGSGTMTLPANFMIVGRTVRIRAKGIATTATSAATLTVFIKVGSVTVCTSAAVAPTIAGTNVYWELEADVTCLTVGSGGTVRAQGRLRISMTVSTYNEWPMPSTATAAMDTTASQLVDVQITQSNATAQTVTTTNLTLEVLD